MAFSRTHKYRTGRIGLALGLALGGLIAGQCVVSVPVSAQARPVSVQTPDRADNSAPPAQAAASRRAVASNRPVEVGSLTTETTQVMANPDGTFTLTTSRQPVRVKQGAQWHPIDPTLHRNTDGTLSPKATTQQLRLSGGGAGSLLTLTDGANQLSFQWPSALPRPVVTGAAAVYPEVMPGVDLQVSVTAESVNEVLVVKNARAAANPALRTVHLTVSSPTLSVARGTDGGLQASDAHGRAVFHGAAPTMWDSSFSAQVGAKPTAADPGGSRVRSIVMTTKAKPAPRTTAAAIAAGGSSLDVALTPPAAALTGAGVVYPVFLDPPMTATRQNFMWVADNGQHPYNTGSDLKVGYCGWDTPAGDACGSPYWTARSYFSLNTTALTGQATTAHIFSAGLHISQIHNAVCDATAAWLTTSGAFSASTVFPGPSGSLIESESSSAGSSCSPSAGDLVFNSANLVANVQSLADHDTKSVSYALSNPYDTSRPAREFWKRFATTPTMNVNYNFPPSTPTGLTIPSAISCGGTNYTSTGNQRFTASAKDNNPNSDGTPGALQPGLWFEVHPYVSSTILAANSSAIRINSGATGSYTTNVAGGFPAGTYQALVRADDIPGSTQDLYSDYSSWYFFNTLSPITQTPTIFSLDYPAGNNWGAPHNKAGKFTLGVGGASTAAGFSFSYDSSNTPVPSGCDYNHPENGIVAGAASASITPPTTLRPGRHVLYVRTFDNAQQLSTSTASYVFYVAPDLPSSGLTIRDEPEQQGSSTTPIVTQPAGQNVATPTEIDLSRYTTGTDRATVGLQGIPAGYHPDGLFGANYLELGGALTTPTAGTHAIYDCKVGTDRFTSTSSTCEGQTVVGVIGYLYDAASSTVATQPLYRCRSSSDHWDSFYSNCEGGTEESILGYTVQTSGRPFSGNRAVVFPATAIGQSISIPFTVPVKAYYAMGLELQTNSLGGELAFTLDGRQPLANTVVNQSDMSQSHGVATEFYSDNRYIALGGQNFDAGSAHTIDVTVVKAGATHQGLSAVIDFLSMLPLNSITYPDLSAAMNNHGISADGHAANLDLNYNNALSSNLLAAAGMAPGQTVTLGDATYTMPLPHNDASGSPVDNVVAAGQVISLPHVKATKVQMLVANTCGTSLESTTTAATFTFKELDPDPFGAGGPLFTDSELPTVPDWGSGATVTNDPNLQAQISLAKTLSYFNRADGTKGTAVNLFTLTYTLSGDYTLDSVTLPNLGSDLLTCTASTIHVLAMSVGAAADTVAVQRPSTASFYLRQSDASSHVIPFGAGTDQPVSGDWDGDGSKTIGAYNSASKTFTLSNDNSSASMTVTLPFAASGDIAVSGDWDGDGKAGVGLFRPSTSSWYLVNNLVTAGTPVPVAFGIAGDKPVVGDWDCNGTTTIGVWRSSNRNFYLNDTNAVNASPTVFALGLAGDLPVAGDWDGNGGSTPGVYRPSNNTFYLTNDLKAGAYALTTYGIPNDQPLVVNGQG